MTVNSRKDSHVCRGKLLDFQCKCHLHVYTHARILTHPSFKRIPNLNKYAREGRVVRVLAMGPTLYGENIINSSRKEFHVQRNWLPVKNGREIIIIRSRF